MAYKSLTDSYIDIVEGKTLKEKGKYTNIWNAIKGVRGVSNKEKDFISNMDPDALFSVIKAIAKKFPRVTEEAELDEASVDLLRKKLKKVKGITKDQIQTIAAMPTPVLTSLINQLSMIVSQKEDVKENVTFTGNNSYIGQAQGELPKELEEAPLVASDITILDGILSKIKDDIIKDKLKGRIEKSWPKMQQLAKLAGYNITKKMQPKGKTYRWDLKK